MDLKAAGFTDAEIAEYQKLQSAGFSPEEIDQYYAQKQAPTGMGGLTAEAANNLPSTIQPHHGETQIGTPKVPEWKQAAMGGVNQLEDIGQAVGAASGMAASLPFGGTDSPWTIPAGAGIGRMAGKALKTPLTQLLLPEAGAEAPGYKEMASTGLHGASGGALDATLGLAVPKIVSHYAPGFETPSKGLDTALQMGEDAVDKIVRTPTSWAIPWEQRISRYLIRRNIRPVTTNPPKENRAIIDNILKHGIQTADISGEAGPGRVAHNIKRLGQTADELVMSPMGERRKVKMSDLLAPLDHLKETLAHGRNPKDLKTIERYLAAFKEMHPGEYVSVAEAQKIKKAMYKIIPDAAWEGHTGVPITEADKAIASNIPNLQAKALGGDYSRLGKTLKETNKELAEFYQMRPAVGRATERIQNSRWDQRALAHSNDIIGRALYKHASRVGKPLWGDQVDKSHIGSPIQALEDLFGVKYGRPLAPPPGSKADGWEQAEGSNAEFRPRTHPDWFRGMKPNLRAEQLGKQIDWQDYRKFKGEIPQGTPITTQTIRPGLPSPKQPLMLPASTSEAKNAPSSMDFGVKGLREPGYPLYQAPTEKLGTPVQGQKLLPAPGMKTTPTNATLTNEDLAALEQIGHDSPGAAMILKKLLGIK